MYVFVIIMNLDFSLCDLGKGVKVPGAVAYKLGAYTKLRLRATRMGLTLSIVLSWLVVCTVGNMETSALVV